MLILLLYGTTLYRFYSGGQAEVFEVFLPRYGQCAVKTFLRLREFNKKIEDYTLTQQKLVNPQSPISVDENNLQTMNIASTNNFCTWIEEMTLSALLSMRREVQYYRFPMFMKERLKFCEMLRSKFIKLNLFKTLVIILDERLLIQYESTGL